MRTQVVLLALAFVAVGCSDNTNAPPPAAMAPRESTPTKIPTTVDEKIEAIKNAPMPEKQKEIEIQKVKSGQL